MSFVYHLRVDKLQINFVRQPVKLPNYHQNTGSELVQRPCQNPTNCELWGNPRAAGKLPIQDNRQKSFSLNERPTNGGLEIPDAKVWDLVWLKRARMCINFSPPIGHVLESWPQINANQLRRYPGRLAWSTLQSIYIVTMAIKIKFNPTCITGVDSRRLQFRVGLRSGFFHSYTHSNNCQTKANRISHSVAQCNALKCKLSISIGLTARCL